MTDYSIELAQILEYVAATAIEIRMHSAYARKGQLPERPEAQYDLLWLSDSLHNFDMLGRAIGSGSASNVIDACDDLIGMYQRYGSNDRDYNSKATFDRVEKKGIRLADAIDVFQAIRAKAIAERDLSDAPAQLDLLESNKL